MSAYLVFSRESTIDEGELTIYSQEVATTPAGHEFKFLAFYGAQENVEGPTTEGTVIMQFPSAEAAMGWYRSPAYQKVREHRFKGARFRVTLVNGV